VANLYFKPENRAVALYYTKKGDAREDDPLLTGLNDEQKAQVQKFKGMLAQMPAEQAKAMLQKIEQQESAAPPEQKDMLQAIKKLLQQKVEKGGR
jgi:hypothetical protein